MTLLDGVLIQTHASGTFDVVEFSWGFGFSISSPRMVDNKQDDSEGRHDIAFRECLLCRC